MSIREQLRSITAGNVLSVLAFVISFLLLVPGMDLEEYVAEHYSPEAGHFFGATGMLLAGMLALTGGLLDRKTDTTGQWKWIMALGALFCVDSAVRFYI